MQQPTTDNEVPIASYMTNQPHSESEFNMSPLQQQHQLLCNPDSLTTNTNQLQQQLEQILLRLQTQPTNPPFANPFSSTSADQNSVSNCETSLTQINSSSMYDVMWGHLLLFPVLEELCCIRHVKLWFFTNEGLKNTRLAKECTRRYNYSRVCFDFERQGLAAKNEYEATMKNAPEDNTLSPYQLNQAMP